MKWYYLSEENEVIGPVSETALRQLKACGEIKNETRICREGTEDWITSEEILNPAKSPTDMPELFKFNCPHCSQHIEADASHTCMEAQCPACGGTMLVPKFPQSNSSEKKLINHAKPKVLLLSVLGLAGLVAIGSIVLINKSSSSRMSSNNGEIGRSEFSATTQKKDNKVSIEYSFSTGPLPKLSRPAPEGFVLIPEGSFTMGDSLDGMEDAPTHEVNLSSFYIGRHEVTRGLWKRVMIWGNENGYAELPKGWDDREYGEPEHKDNHPANGMNWYGAVVWCNAYSEMEGLRPCYLFDGEILRASKLIDSKNDFRISCDFTSNGYRLPTEAEWEKAARGGQSGTRFPWGDRINQQRANYTAYFESEPYQERPTIDQVKEAEKKDGRPRPELMRIAWGESTRNPYTGQDKAYRFVGEWPHHTNVSSFPPNGFGLYDMIGNASEWCWDAYDEDFYNYSPKLNPIGPPSRDGIEDFGWRHRVYRGGEGETNALPCRVAARSNESPRQRRIGFRLVCR